MWVLYGSDSRLFSCRSSRVGRDASFAGLPRSCDGFCLGAMMRTRGDGCHRRSNDSETEGQGDQKRNGGRTSHRRGYWRGSRRPLSFISVQRRSGFCSTKTGAGRYDNWGAGVAGQISCSSRPLRTPIDAHDTLITAQALARGLTLVTAKYTRVFKGRRIEAHRLDAVVF